MANDPERIYREFVQLLATTPAALHRDGTLPIEAHQWIGRGYALLNEVHGGMGADLAMYRTASDHVGGGDLMRPMHAAQILAILHRALAVAERKAPPATQGAFIPVGAALTALQVVGKVLAEAKVSVLIVDAYMDSTVLTDFASMAPNNVAVHLLTDSFYTKPEVLKPVADRWVKQYGAARPLSVRFTTPRQLHDRLIVVDSTRVWVVTQSLKDMVGRAPASVLRVDDDEMAKAKIHAYDQLWVAATPL